MKLKSVVTRTLAAIAVLSLSAAPVAVGSALAAGPAVILIVNTEAVFAQSKVGQSIRTQFQEQAKKLQAESTKAEEKLQADAKKLSDDRALLSQEDLQKKFQALQKNEMEHQQSMQEKGQALQLGVQQANAKVEAALRPIFAEVMKEKGGTVLFDQSVIVAGGSDLDISAEVLKRLNEKLTTVEVKPVSLAELQAQQKNDN
ncbi:MAG: OmpH family outer membrane protein [Parvibaculum sp.]|uniref:OmpH family outer membrane protein n=1 Tax=Parvibaculum sp. TaxID=2024848 RepID=UPI0032F021E7